MIMNNRCRKRKRPLRPWHLCRLLSCLSGESDQEYEAQRAEDMETRLQIMAELIALLHSSESLERTGESVPIVVEGFGAAV